MGFGSKLKGAFIPDHKGSSGSGGVSRRMLGVHYPGRSSTSPTPSPWEVEEEETPRYRPTCVVGDNGSHAWRLSAMDFADVSSAPSPAPAPAPAPAQQNTHATTTAAVRNKPSDYYTYRSSHGILNGIDDDGDDVDEGTLPVQRHELRDAVSPIEPSPPAPSPAPVRKPHQAEPYPRKALPPCPGEFKGGGSDPRSPRKTEAIIDQAAALAAAKFASANNNTNTNTNNANTSNANTNNTNATGGGGMSSNSNSNSHIYQRHQPSLSATGPGPNSGSSSHHQRRESRSGGTYNGVTGRGSPRDDFPGYDYQPTLATARSERRWADGVGSSSEGSYHNPFHSNSNSGGGLADKHPRQQQPPLPPLPPPPPASSLPRTPTTPTPTTPTPDVPRRSSDRRPPTAMSTATARQHRTNTSASQQSSGGGGGSPGGILDAGVPEGPPATLPPPPPPTSSGGGGGSSSRKHELGSVKEAARGHELEAEAAGLSRGGGSGGRGGCFNEGSHSHSSSTTTAETTQLIPLGLDGMAATQQQKGHHHHDNEAGDSYKEAAGAGLEAMEGGYEPLSAHAFRRDRQLQQERYQNHPQHGGIGSAAHSRSQSQYQQTPSNQQQQQQGLVSLPQAVFEPPPLSSSHSQSRTQQQKQHQHRKHQQSADSGYVGGGGSVRRLRSNSDMTSATAARSRNVSFSDHFGPGHPASKVVHACEHCGRDNDISRYFRRDAVYRIG